MRLITGEELPVRPDPIPEDSQEYQLHNEINQGEPFQVVKPDQHGHHSCKAADKHKDDGQIVVAVVLCGIQPVTDVEHGPHQDQHLEHAGDEIQQVSHSEAHVTVQRERHQMLAQVEAQADGNPGNLFEKMFVSGAQHEAGDRQQDIAQHIRQQVQHQMMADHMVYHQVHGLRGFRGKRFKGGIIPGGETNVHRQQQYRQKQYNIGRQFFIHHDLFLVQMIKVP